MKVECIIVDDNEDELKKVNKVLHQLSMSLDVTFYTHCHTDLTAKEINNIYDLYILDIDMPKIDGFDLANVIFDNNPKATIIFCTNHDNLIYEAIKLNTFFFVRKSFLENDLLSALQKYIKNYSHETSTYQYKTRSETKYIKFEDIFYFEVSRNDLYIHLKDSTTLTERKTMSKVISELRNDDFLRIDKNFLINLKYADHIEDNYLVCKNNMKFDIPKNKMKQIKDELNLYRMRNVYV